MKRSEGRLRINLDCLLGGLLIKAVIYRVEKKEKKKEEVKQNHKKDLKTKWNMLLKNIITAR